MSEGNKNIDKLFNEAFSESQFPMDEAMWADANAMLKANKSKPSYLGYVSATVAVITLIGASVFFFTGEYLNAKSNTYTQRDESSQVTFLETSTQENESSFSNKTLAKNHSKLNSQEKPMRNSMVDYNSKHIVLANNSASIEEVDSAPNKKTNTIVTASLLANNTTPSSTKNKQSNSSSNNETIHKGQKTSLNSTNLKNQNFELSDENRTSTDNFLREEFVHLTPQTHVELMNEPLSENPKSQKKNSHPKMFVPFTIRLSAGYGIGSILNSSELNSNSSYTANQTNIDFSLEYAFTPNWGIQSGLTYNLINETQTYRGLSIENNSYFDYQDNSYWNYFDKEVILEDKTWWLGDWWVYGTYTDTIIDSNYVTQIDSNLVPNFDSTQTNFSERQKITQLEIPVLVTYSFVHKRWVFQVATGATFGIFLNSKGKMIRFTDDMVTGINSSKDFFNSLQYNYLLSTEVGFGLNEHWRITARPQMKVNLNSMFNSESGYSQKYLFYGVNIGMAFNF